MLFDRGVSSRGRSEQARKGPRRGGCQWGGPWPPTAWPLRRNPRCTPVVRHLLCVRQEHLAATPTSLLRAASRAARPHLAARRGFRCARPLQAAQGGTRDVGHEMPLRTRRQVWGGLVVMCQPSVAGSRLKRPRSCGYRSAWRVSHKPSGPSTSCAFATRCRFWGEPFQPRRTRSGRLRRSHEVTKNRRCQIRTTALVCATASMESGSDGHRQTVGLGRRLERPTDRILFSAVRYGTELEVKFLASVVPWAPAQLALAHRRPRSSASPAFVGGSRHRWNRLSRVAVPRGPGSRVICEAVEPQPRSGLLVGEA